MRVVAWTYSGEVYCDDCAGDEQINLKGTPQAIDTRGDEPTPVFATDEIPAHWTCGDCDINIASL